MKKTQKNRKTLSHLRIALLCIIIAMLSFSAGISLGLHASFTVKNPDTSVNDETQNTATQASSTDEKRLEGIHDMPTSPAPSTDLPLNTEKDNTTSSTNSTNVNTTKCKEQETDEEIMQNPDSYERYKTIDDKYNFHDKIQLMYFNGEWDGEPMVLDGHYISISDNGYILADMHCLDSQKTVDLPPDFDTRRVDSCNLSYIPGKGTYFVDDETYIYCSNGEEFKLGKVNWKEGTGIDVDYHHPFIHYDDVNSTMFLWTPMIYSYGIVYDYTYLYIFPDCDTAKIEFVAQVKDLDFDEKGLKYIDMGGTEWRYFTKN